MFRAISRLFLCLSFVVAGALPSLAGGADVTAVKATKLGNGTYRFDVTVRHADAGWDHYANSWQVLSPNGQLLATRTLAHPHVNEQPFTRSLSGVSIPNGINEVIVRAGDSVHGFGGAEKRVKLP